VTEVPISERAVAVSVAGAALDAMAREWLEARASGDCNRLEAAGPALDACVQDYRRAQSKLDKTLRRLEKHAAAPSDQETT
jgi:hypothetical protein